MERSFLLPFFPVRRAARRRGEETAQGHRRPSAVPRRGQRSKVKESIKAPLPRPSACLNPYPFLLGFRRTSGSTLGPPNPLPDLPLLRGP